MLVYIFKCLGRHKIGWTNDLRQRLRRASRDCPYEIETVFALETPQARELEAKIHKEFSQFRKIGEWFELTDFQVKLVISFAQRTAATLSVPAAWHPSDADNWSPESIAKLRRHLGMSVAEFAKECGVNRTNIYFWETGRSHPLYKQLFELNRVAQDAAKLTKVG